MRQHDDNIRAFIPGTVHGFLHRMVQRLAGFILAKAVNKLPFCVLKILGRGAGQRFGRCDPDKRDLRSVYLFHQVGVEHQLAFMIEVAADIGEIRLFRQAEELFHAVVEVMVPGDYHVVFQFVHQVQDGLAPGHGSNRFALEGVAVVHQEHGIAAGSQAVADLLHADIAETLIDAAVHVAGIEDDNIAVRSGLFGKGRAAGQHQQYCQHQQYGESALLHGFHAVFLHVFSPVFYFLYTGNRFRLLQMYDYVL